ncbi:hypothetical protein CO2235_MP20257 [Cupriavidus oxalaticus]|uniref:Uncharacterized protein n=1 Tax=Cupriavidus oxalaticus TaxID=96344 RepID=A0A976BI19_9BURK|nr:hypothetical protein CO2235_MP20257 [Cupriavidus oxalaticus]
MYAVHNTLANKVVGVHMNAKRVVCEASRAGLH